jgi:hypothetical protein
MALFRGTYTHSGEERENDDKTMATLASFANINALATLLCAVQKTRNLSPRQIQKEDRQGVHQTISEL